MAPTFSEIEADPTILCKYLKSRGLLEKYVETESLAKIQYPAENVESFIWGHLKKFMAHRGGAYVFKFNNLDIFYDILCPQFSNSEIVQLESLLTFVEHLFNADNPTIVTSSCSIMVMKPTLSFVNSYFTIMYNVTQGFTLKTQHTELTLADCSFNTVYNAILCDLKVKIEQYFGQNLPIIDTNIFKSILNESAQSYKDRIFSNSVVKPLIFDDFKESVESVKSIIINEKIKLNYNDEALYLNKATFELEQRYVYSFYLSLKNIPILKQVLKKSMNSKDIDLLISSISMTAFHQTIKKPDNPINYVKFIRYEKDDSNKTAISKKEYFYSVSVGDDYFTLGSELAINLHSPNCIKVDSMQTLYQEQFNKITSDICTILATDRDNVSILDLEVINMSLV